MKRLARCVLLLVAWPVSALATPDLESRPRSVPIVLDGHLDEADWQLTPTSEHFVERTPTPDGQPPVRTVLKVLHDAEALYLGIRLEHPPGHVPRAYELHRDSFSIWADDTITLKFDVRLDRRNTVGFAFNSRGTQLDYVSLENGSIFRREYDAVWEVATARFADHWVAEVRLPAAALGIPSRPGEQRMGLNVARDYTPLSATYYWAPIPPELSPNTAQRYGTLRGVRGMGGGRPLSLRPYALGGWQWTPEERSEWRGRGGATVAMRLGEDSWGELTALTDFAEVDVDPAVLNLTRFPIFLPERRPFFLSGLDVFEFGQASLAQVFYSRRIGADQDVLGGLKLYGRAGEFSYGLLDVVTATEALPDEPDPDSPVSPGSNWSVIRARQSFGAHGHIGVIGAGRHTLFDPQAELRSSKSHYSGGVDLTLRSADSRWRAAAFASATYTRQDGPADDPAAKVRGHAGQIELGYTGIRFQPTVAALIVDEDFDPEVGLVRRPDLLELRSALPFVERVSFWKLESLQAEASGALLWEPSRAGLAGARGEVGHAWNWRNKWSANAKGTLLQDRVPAPAEGESPFSVADRVDVEPGLYRNWTGRIGFRSPFTRDPSLDLGLHAGTLYGGTRTGIEGKLRYTPTRHLRMSIKGSLDQLRFPGRTPFLTGVANARANLAANTRLLLTCMGQYSSVSGSWTALGRLRWRYWPGSDLLLVYQEQLEPSDEDGRTRSSERSLVLKLGFRHDMLI